MNKEKLEDYLILIPSQSGVRLFNAKKDSITGEVKNEDFPFPENDHFVASHNKVSDSKKIDNMAKEFFNTIDKAMVRVYNTTNQKCVVFCTEDNYSMLTQVADRPSIYYGHIKIDINNSSKAELAVEAWKMVHPPKTK
jgi:dihydrofolate reductase